jgi:hypothetical protein
MLRCDTPCGLLLSVTQVVEAQGASNYSRRIFDAFQSYKRNEIYPTVFARIDLQPPETVLAEAPLDDPAPVASWAEIRFGLDGWTEAPELFSLRDDSCCRSASETYPKRTKATNLATLPRGHATNSASHASDEFDHGLTTRGGGEER